MKWLICSVVIVLALLGCQDKIYNLYTNDESIAKTPEHQGVIIEFNFLERTVTCFNRNDSWGVTADVRTTGNDFRVIANWDLIFPRANRVKENCTFHDGEEVRVTVRRHHLPGGNIWDNWRQWFDSANYSDESSIVYVLHDS